MSILRFGIPSLDSLIDNGTETHGAASSGLVQSTSLSIIGPDGTGKSILGLHLASHYLFDHRADKRQPLVLYVSTDLSYPMAHDRTWLPFALNYPGRRTVPFDDAGAARVTGEDQREVALDQLRPLSEESAPGHSASVSSFINGGHAKLEELKDRKSKRLNSSH